MKTIITPADLAQYVPGEIWLDAVDGRWSGLSIRGCNRQLIAEIASATGFSDQSHLTRQFKREFGVTPQECRKDDRSFVSGSLQQALTDVGAIADLGSD